MEKAVSCAGRVIKRTLLLLQGAYHVVGKMRCVNVTNAMRKV